MTSLRLIAKFVVMSENMITIDVVSDVACPWCYIGKRKFEAALTKWNRAPIKVTWHPYQLDPSMPESGLTRDNYLVNKFGSIEATTAMTERLSAAGKEVDINFDFGEKWLAVNTLQLHQLLNVAREEGFNEALKERFFKAYFEEARELNKPEELYAIAAEFGWDATKVDQIIANKELASAVQKEIAHFQNIGVSGVPFFILNNKYGMSGAQPVEAFLEAFENVSKESIA